MRMMKKLITQGMRLFANRSNASKVAYLRRQGCILGEKARLNCRIGAFGTEPYLVTLGDHVCIAVDVRFITHDGGVFVLKGMNRLADNMDKIAPIRVGNNVYIGTGAYIMPGVKIGDNCIIGAGTIVTKDVLDNSVTVGVPARVIGTVEAYHERCMQGGCLYETSGMTQKQKRQFYDAMKLRDTYFHEEAK